MKYLDVGSKIIKCMAEQKIKGRYNGKTKMQK